VTRGRFQRLFVRLGGIGPSGRALAVFAVFGLVATGLFGLPALTRLSSVYVGTGGSDQNLFAWSLVWWPHALRSGQNPFHADVLWAPDGVNLAWVTAVPGPSLLASPLTDVFGPIASLNLLLLAAPALAGWAAYLVCRQVTGTFWPSVAGGYMFGFSTYLVAKVLGHLNLALVFLVPLALYLVLRRLNRTMGRVPFLLLLTATLVGQFSISTEVFATMTVFGGTALVGAYLFGSGRVRADLPRTAALILIAYLAAGLVVSPYLYLALTDIPSAPIRDLDKASSDLLSFAVPRAFTFLGGETLRPFTTRFTAPARGDTAYLGLPLLALLLLFAVEGRRSRTTWAILSFVGVAAVASLGPTLHVGGRPLFPLPWTAVEGLPLINKALPDRFTMYVWLAVAVVVAMWLAAPGRRTPLFRWALVLLAAIAIAPRAHSPPDRRQASIPPFFRGGLYERYLRRGDLVLIIPYGTAGRAADMLWQATTDMHFSMVGGHVGFVPSSYEGLVVLRFHQGRPELVDAGALAAFLSSHRVAAVLVTAEERGRWRGLLSTLGVPSVSVGGMVVYPLAGRSPDGAGRMDRAVPPVPGTCVRRRRGTMVAGPIRTSRRHEPGSRCSPPAARPEPGLGRTRPPGTRTQGLPR
jgi:hypothetical protein